MKLFKYPNVSKKVNTYATLSGGPNVATILGCRVKGVGNGQTLHSFLSFFSFVMKLHSISFQSYHINNNNTSFFSNNNDSFNFNTSITLISV